MRPDRMLLEDIVAAAIEIGSFIEGYSHERFLNDNAIRSAVLYQLIVIGEAANRLSPSLKANYPGVPWRPVVDQRNAVAHGYFSLDGETIWMTAYRDVPALRREIESILEQEMYS